MPKIFDMGGDHWFDGLISKINSNWHFGNYTSFAERMTFNVVKADLKTIAEQR